MRRYQEPRPVEIHDGSGKPGEFEQASQGGPGNIEPDWAKALPRPKCEVGVLAVTSGQASSWGTVRRAPCRSRPVPAARPHRTPGDPSQSEERRGGEEGR